MTIDFDEELAELEEILFVFSSNQDRSFSNEEICRLLETDDQETDQIIEKIHKSFGVHNEVTFLQLEGFVRERIELITQLKEQAQR